MSRAKRWPGNRPAPRRNLRWDSPEATRWDVLNIGYEAGIRDALARGIEIGRAQVEAEDRALWHQVRLTCLEIANRPGPLGWAEREEWRRQQTRDRDPDAGLTGEQLREKAARSWGMPYRPQQSTTDPTTANRHQEAA